MNYYKVTVTVTSVSKWEEYKEQVFFKSLFAARYMAKKYFACADVNEVVVTDETTGEIMYSVDYKDGEYDPCG